MGKQSGQPVTEYESEIEALAAASYIVKTYHNQLVPYHCTVCGAWHLSPADRHTASTECPDCTDCEGNPKKLYRTEKDAMRRADILLLEQDVQLRVYPCPHSSGYHLTKNLC